MNRSAEAATRILFGLAAAEAASWGAMYQRALLLPYWTRRKRREIEDLHDRDGLTEIPVPFALNQPDGALRAGPGPRSEWLAFQLRLLATAGGRYDRAAALRAWRALADEAPSPRLSLSQRAALDHLRAGTGPPRSGHDHAHPFDDAACVRALAFAPFAAGNRGALRRAVAADAAITNAGDGIRAAVAVAALTADLLDGAPVRDAVRAAAAGLPSDGWLGDRVERALEHADASTGTLDLALRLDRDLANAGYSYGDAAPDVVPLAFAIVERCGGRAEASLLAALAIPRHAPALAPLVGALCAAHGDVPAPVADLAAHLPVFAGVALPALRGVSLAAVVVPPPTPDAKDPNHA